MNMLSIFLNVLLPVFIVAGMGALLDHWFEFDQVQLSRLSLSLLSPALVFTSIVNSALALGDVAVIAGIAMAVFFGLMALGQGMARVLNLGTADRNAFLLSTTLVNAGNFGLSVMLLALGRPGLERGVIFFVASSIFANSVGVYLARRGVGNTREAIAEVFKVPLAYATMLALVVKLSGIEVPGPLLKPFELIGSAAVPFLLLILGIRLHRVRLSASMPWIALASGVKLLLSPALAYLLTLAFGVQGLTQQVLILQAGMPTAVFATVLAIRFEVDSDIVAGTIAVSTLVSALTLTGLMWALGLRPGG